MNREKCLTEMWDKIIKFNDTYFPNWRNVDEVYYSNALAGEAGEVCNLVKHRVGGGTNLKNKDLSDFKLLLEIADVFIYMVLLVESKYVYDITTLADAVDEKIKINENRLKEDNVKSKSP